MSAVGVGFGIGAGTAVGPAGLGAGANTGLAAGVTTPGAGAVPKPGLVEVQWSALKVRPKDLMEAALRMRPDRVIFPELRDGTAYCFLRSVASGHPGVITTIHANSAATAWENIDVARARE